MQFLTTIAALEALYGTPGETSLRKVAHHLTPEYRDWIMASRFCVISTVGPEGTDASPRGDDGPVVRALDDRHLALPDWAGNNRIDTLRNILRDDRASLMFLVPGSNNVVRVNGCARVTADATLRQSFERQGKQPRSVVVLQIDEVYFQCARALLRSRLWSGADDSAGLPSAGALLAALTDGAVGGADYDRDWPERAAKSLW
ncbi:pyridoxamine 5'-phosphate oxidase family protein [Pseudooceanicola sp.]|uniref:pyridoxamine 5'-phosphate oxidase family protein n=1 Tax=Pseudooceanicola sp. TaxID=1914328 RepID=UPI0026320012|nr:pyridoxamine 5'-phosphate oxidase family protein [Pseudooceanicola sp.]MDF1855321.1 pyridoxamine 5'-phosphate oxidase family protein [Pseudooceanicola sp.]